MRFTTSRSRRITRAAAVALGAALLTPALATPAQAAGTNALCTNAITLHLSPGFSATPGWSASTSRGETGTQLCTGTVAGRHITGPGTVGVEETTYANCLTDHSSGVVSVTLPTTAGPMHMSGPLTGRRLGLVEFVEIDFPQGHFSGSGPVAPTRGDCAFTPITQALVSITGTLRG